MKRLLQAYFDKELLWQYERNMIKIKRANDGSGTEIYSIISNKLHISRQQTVCRM